MSDDLLQQIQQLQFSDKPAAERKLSHLIHDLFGLDVVSVELRPLAVSLNSFNGFVSLRDGSRLFFKTHTEPDNVIGEYYHAALLAEAGYPVIRPVLSSTEAGRQLLMYDVIESPSVFDVAWSIENGDVTAFAALTHAQNTADDELLRLYRSSLHSQTAAEAGAAAVHQLFYHRLTGGRLARFYGEATSIALPDGEHHMADVRQVRWIINGQEYAETLDMLIGKAISLLQPAQAGPAVVGHGDAHNGNVFFSGESLVYFDPAFAGRHHPLLDLTKPLFHNVFAMWMYFPLVKQQQTSVTLRREQGVWHVTHDYALHPIREMFLMSKVNWVLVPILRDLGAKSLLRAGWRDYLKAAMFCCPLLTMNLADSQKFPPEISLLGLAMAVEMGGESQGTRSYIDKILDEAEKQLQA